jgi:hypothetical protein
MASKTSSKPSAVRRSEALPTPALLISKSSACHRDRTAHGQHHLGALAGQAARYFQADARLAPVTTAVMPVRPGTSATDQP